MKKLVIVLALSALISACGFQPRGSVSSLKSVGNVEVVHADKYSDLAVQLRRSLERSGSLMPEGGTANARIKILSEEYQLLPLTVGATAQILEYRARYKVNFNLELADGTAVLQNDDVVLTREYLFNSLGAGGNPAEEEASRQEMVRDMQAQIVRRAEFALRKRQAPATN
jgi:outer membrane lipopolysaccharide assembly protein LptE/RlpB